MSRLLFWLALAFLVMFAIRSKLRGLQQRGREQQPFTPPPSRGPAARGRVVEEAEPMLACAHCGIYYPESESVKANGRDFCSAAHAHASAP